MPANGRGTLAVLVLGGGGSLGAVGVGLYRALVELGIRIDLIVTRSIGAVTAALIAAGLSFKELENGWTRLGTRYVVGTCS